MRIAIFVQGGTAETRGARYIARFATDAQGAAFVKAKSSGYALSEIEEDPIEDGAVLTLAALYPECEHGLSLQLCAGPGHYPADERY